MKKEKQLRNLHLNQWGKMVEQLNVRNVTIFIVKSIIKEIKKGIMQTDIKTVKNIEKETKNL